MIGYSKMDVGIIKNHFEVGTGKLFSSEHEILYK